MPKNGENEREKNNSEFKSEVLIKPEKMIINNNGKHILLYNERDKRTVYDRISEEAKTLLNYTLNENEPQDYKVLPIDFLRRLRSGSNVEIIYPFSYDIKLMAGLLENNIRNWRGMENIDSVIISFDSNLFYIVDRIMGNIYEFNYKEEKSSIKVLLDIINKSKNYSYVFLNEVDKEKYGEDVLIPIYSSPYKLPKLTAKNELNDNNIKDVVADFFGMEINSLRSIVEPNGSVLYTDGSEKGLKIEKSGFIEYMNYSDSIKPQKMSLSSHDLVNIATEFLSRYLGFPKDAYISSIENINDESCIIRYDYRYEGIPIINDIPQLHNSMEIEIAEGKVKRFRRLFRKISETDEMKEIKNPLDIIDILYKRLSDKNIDYGDILIKDVYLSYMEYGQENDIHMLPVWVVDIIQGEGKEGRYMMNAESAVILREP